LEKCPPPITTHKSEIPKVFAIDAILSLFSDQRPTPTQKAMIKECFALASRELPLGEPLDWMESAFPKRWKLKGEEENFDWG
jgi:hypothetical protein